MERLLDVLLKGAEPGLTPRAVCTCRECATARGTSDTHGPCPVQVERLRAFLAQRLRLDPARGAGTLGRLLEDVRRYARLMSSSQAVGLRVDPGGSRWAPERPLHVFPIESES